MGLLKKVFAFSGILIFIYIITTQIELKSLALILKKANFLYFFPAFIFTFMLNFLKIFRCYKLLKINELEVSFRKFLELYSHTKLYASISNLIVSEGMATFLVMFKQEKNRQKVVSIFFLCNFFDLLAITLLCLISLLFSIKMKIIDLAKFKFFNFSNYTFIFIAFIVLAIIIYSFKNKLKSIIGPLKKYKISSQSFKILFLFTILVYTSYVLTAFFQAKLFNVEVNIFYLILIFTGGSLISIIPISINGLGTREAFFIFLLKIKNFNNEQAFSLSIFAFLVMPLLTLFSIYLFSLIINRILK